MRAGIGYDSHRLVVGRPLILGGQRIPHDRGLEGHSDADAIAHALTDAILGAAAMGDIGRLFPDSEPKWKGADSMVLLRLACEQVAGGGFTPRQADITVILEGPRLARFIPAMIEGLSRATGIAADALSIKAKTNEGMGFIGRGEGVAVMAVATVEST
ncbi:MAG: 2-C-methyl-D-erythritol 2,4-cyclodiphosphate synthase [Gemmatimonadota bacterium]|nr:2-C-methyl-D-erythritol 2,4-cyclodiphosphate synthase [Gemmatimonadota bacterium]MDH4347644.1 2-C-methyl-D-erythritol 2,4-cyclodiphosphate synthase [Gemmatimonadota bacterium]MDH5283924.1 2-C-methyl-D-erythritol 2,4-cyclodiphosphate synthase [Gemmatimonadota bacterium]